MKSRNKTPKSERYLYALFAMLLFTTGCASVFNPYDSEFQCPDTDKGRCVGIPTAYEISVSGDDPGNAGGSKSERPGGSDNLAKTAPPASNSEAATADIKYDYLNKKYEKMAALIGKPATPLVVPPDVVRVLILSYTGSDNNLFGYRYVYFFASKPRWIMSSGKEID
ncbi:MAG: TraV family lipoprotein [Desulfobacterales bacterium]|nr:TraV family lipoprotein [Desulfobacterales bacterium]